MNLADRLAGYNRSQFFRGSDGNFYSDPSEMPEGVITEGVVGRKILLDGDTRWRDGEGGPTTQAGVDYLDRVRRHALT